jgi:hypothetical protein
MFLLNRPRYRLSNRVLLLEEVTKMRIVLAPILTAII